MDKLEELEKLYSLKEKGILTEEEFENEKKKILNKSEKLEEIKNEKLAEVDTEEQGNENDSEDKKDKNNLGLKIFFIILGLAILGVLIIGIIPRDDEDTPIEASQVQENTSEPVAEKPNIEEEKQEKINQEKKDRTEKEMKRIEDKISKYEDKHLSTWNELEKSIQSKDVIGTRENAEKSLVQVEEIIMDLDRSDWCGTGEAEVDKNCNKLKENLSTSYLSKQTTLKKLLECSEDINSSEKLNEAKKSMKETAKDWKKNIKEFLDK